MSPHLRFIFWLCLLAASTSVTAADWTPAVTQGTMHPRHEAAFVALGGKAYLLGGRRLQPVDILDPATGVWTQGSTPPVEVHHFQAVVWENKIWLVGAMTGRYPQERALDHIPVYDPATDSWSRGPSLPEHRRRGGAGAVIRDGKLYVVCGIINGHWDGHVAWLDELDLSTGTWRELPDAPRARDHFQTAIVADKLYAAGGRRSWAARKETFNHVEACVDVYDFKTGTWTTLPSPAGDLPLPRAGSMSIAVGRHLVVAGGESLAQGTAHAEVHALDTVTGSWSAWPALVRGRHGSGLARLGDRLYVASGSGTRGGSPELDSVEGLDLADLAAIRP
jgi:N-acetylneuraminic acid mutarotase